MKRLLIVLLIGCVGLLGVACEQASGTSEEIVIGRIVEAREEGWLIEQSDGAQYLALHTDETRIDADVALTAGDYMIVTYNGILTKSFPAQLTAMAIQSFSLAGPVIEVDRENNRLLIDSLEAGQVWATMPAHEEAAAFEGKVVCVYYNGMMALSLPGQITAIGIREAAVEEDIITDFQSDEM